MFPNPQCALPLPPSIEQYKKLAKELVGACNSSGSSAIKDWSTKWIHALVKLNSNSSAVKLPSQVDDWVDQVTEFALHKLSRAGTNPAKCTLAAAHFVIARSHGFAGWSQFVKHLGDLARSDSAAAQFESAADAIVSGDPTTLEQMLRANPALIRERSRREHRATLLHYVSANGVETYRQKTPENILQIAKVLLDAGSDIQAAANVYGGDSTTLSLVATSRPPLLAGVQNELLDLLLEHGATAGATLIPICLANGHVGAAQFLAKRGSPLDIEGAAGVGNRDEVRTHFDRAGILKSPATDVKLQRGFLWACEFGHNDVVEFLLKRGADLRDQAGTREPALHWAVVGGRLSTIELLLGHDAPLEELNSYGGTALGQALWSFVNGDAEIDYVPIIEMLLAAGAKIEDFTLAWLEKQKGHAPVAKARIADVLRRYGAVD